MLKKLPPRGTSGKFELSSIEFSGRNWIVLDGMENMIARERMLIDSTGLEARVRKQPYLKIMVKILTKLIFNQNICLGQFRFSNPNVQDRICSILNRLRNG